MRRIHILGAAGAGKSALGRNLAERIDAAHVDTDDVYWLPTNPPFRDKRPVAERIAMLREMLPAHDRIVLTGSLSGWGESVVALLNGIVLLDTPVAIRLERLSRRERERYGAAIDPAGPLHPQHTALLEWAAAYDGGTMPGRSRARDEAWIGATGLPALRLDGARGIPELVAQTCRWIALHTPETMLVEASDDDFAALLRGEISLPGGLAVPPGGVDDPAVLTHVRAIAARLRAAGYEHGHWLVVARGEVVGAIGFKDPPANGEVEIGYGIAAARRRRGHATRAVGLVLDAARRDPAIRAVLAETDAVNHASQRVLEQNGFVRDGTRFDASEGEVFRWRASHLALWSGMLEP
jgi:RimJ/RimL family protein N-acetyltransferase/adenylate kinase family enzyme